MKVFFLRHNLDHVIPNISAGVGIISTILHQDGISVKAIDNNSFYKRYSDRALLKIMKKYKPDIVAVNLAILNVLVTFNFVKKVKKLCPDLLIVGGGIFMDYGAKEALDNGIDVVVSGQAENIAVPLFRKLEGANKDNFRDGLAEIAGVSFLKEDGSMHVPKTLPDLPKLETLPFVDYKLLNIDDYIKHKNEPGVIGINGQRGCPYKCTFCSDTSARADRRIASADYMFRWVVYNYENYGNPYISIVDNNFFMLKGRVIEFCNKMIESGMNKKVRISCASRIETMKLDDEYAALIKEAGFTKIEFGLERLDPFSLKMINKPISKKLNEEVFHMLTKHDINFRINVMLGFPFETMELLNKERKAFMDLAKQFKNCVLDCSILEPMPGTIYYDNYPKNHGWYLIPGFNKLIKTYFSKIFCLTFSDATKHNYFDLPKDVLIEIDKTYHKFNIYCHEKRLMEKTLTQSIVFKLDYILAHFSRLIFYISPSLELFIFRKINALRYYLGTLYIGKDVT